ncbi:MAG: nitroreductase family protein [Candidatus Bathyarchaeia archaeon]
MDLFEVIKNRRSIRAFKSTPIPDEIVNKILEAACWAPSAGNLQSWEFILVKDEKTKEWLCDAALGQCFIQEAPLAIVVCANRNRSSSRYGSRGANLYSICDSSAAIQNILLSAYALGLGSCWVGAFHDDEVARILELPDGIRPVAIIPVGYPNESPKPPRRFPLDKVVHKERYK